MIKTVKILSSKIFIKSTKKLKYIFLKYDADYNGYLNREEFYRFIDEVTKNKASMNEKIE